MDETRAARKPVLRWRPETGAEAAELGAGPLGRDDGIGAVARLSAGLFRLRLDL